jgi:ribosome-binding factor A
LSKKNNNFKLNVREQVQSQRQQKVSQLIQAALVDCLRKGKALSPRLFDMPLTITKVNISPDLKIANCYIIPFNTSLPHEEILTALEESRYYVRQYVTEAINLKYSPELRFYYDADFENTAIVEKLLRASGK